MASKGYISIADTIEKNGTTHYQTIMPNTPTLVEWTDVGYDHVTYIPMEIGPTHINAQLYFILPAGSNNPTTITIETSRKLGDETGEDKNNITSTATAWAVSYNDIDYLGASSKRGIMITHNGRSSITLASRILKAINAAAYIADRAAPKS
jgi:hypothetical protein